ncbi:MAG TPA: DNA-processing protein DprA [Ignavibacteriaceae bacterium]|nr:DNA-processing protein DprA [Ignavibacteriaceae bacterium]
MTKLSYEQLIDLQILLSVDGIGPVKIKHLIHKFKKFETILSSDLQTLSQVEGINVNLAKRIINAQKERVSSESEIKKRFDKLFKMNGQIITIWDSEYPQILKKIYDPPIILYTIGKFEESDKYSLAIVGTRNPTNYGKIQSENFASDLVEQNIVIVSGLARGIDSCAHTGALKKNGRTIAILGNGLDVVYPPENRKLRDEIAEKGMLISENEIGTKPDAQNFPRRNRIISGLSLGTLVIESGISGGAIQTAEFALDQNREVFAIPGNIGVTQSEGTNLLIQKGEAKLVLNTEDILNELEFELSPINKKKPIAIPQNLNIFESKIFELVNNEPIHIDSISKLCDINTSECLVHLLSLEFKGVIKQLPGKMFIRY